VACQVAHSVFGIQKKIARIRNKEYRDPSWSNLFSRNHMPIDVIISPEDEIAEAIMNRMSVPGTSNDISLLDNTIHIAGYVVDESSTLVGDSLNDLYLAYKDIDFNIFMVVRENSPIICTKNTILEQGDEIYFICQRDELLTLLERLGNKNDIYKGNIIICGGGVIGEALAQKVLDSDTFKKNNLIVIEQDIKKGREINARIKDALVINGSALDYDILKEAGTEGSAIFISVMNSNENNVLSAVLAKKMGSNYSIALNNNRIYTQLIPDHLVDAIVNPEAITVSRVLHNLTRNNIKAIHTIRNTGVEIIEAEVREDCSIVNIPLKELKLPSTVAILGTYNKKERSFRLSKSDTVIHPGDNVILASFGAKVQDIESLFSFSVHLF
jgi:trk system potassium uptake protein TrkA